MNAEKQNKLKLFVGVVNGNRVYKHARDLKHFETLCRIEALAKYGRFDLTDWKVLRRKNIEASGNVFREILNYKNPTTN